MKIYLAGSPGYSAAMIIKTRWRLHTFFRLNLSEVEDERKAGVETALDSGAFSAWALGSPVKLPDYISFLHEHEHLFSWYANLDVITDPVKSAKATWENQCEMEANGLNPVPVFHFKEDPIYLKKYLDRYEFIALGGMVELPTPQLYSWLDDIFTNYLVDSTGTPRVKVHGFGWTAPRLINRYPWYSADSSTWVKMSGRGVISIPKKKPKRKQGSGANYDFTRSPDRYDVFLAPSDPNNNVWSVPAPKRRWIERFLESHDLSLGESKIVWWPRGKGLPENGQVINKYRPINKIFLGAFSSNDSKYKTHQPIELVISPGVCNTLRMRRQAMACYYIEMAEAFPWPRPFEHKKRLQRRFFV